MQVPLPPRRDDGAAPAMVEAKPAAQAAPAVNNEGPMDGLGGLGGEIGMLLEGLFGKAFGGTPSYPGYKWDGFEGWVPDGTAAAPKAPASPAPSPAPAQPVPLPPRRPAGI